MTERNAGDLQATVDKLGLRVASRFIPFSKSRNKAEKSPSLNWEVTLYRGDVAIIVTDYGAGSGHCPASKASVRQMGEPNSLMRDAAIRFECEHGKAAISFDNANSPSGYTVRELHPKGAQLQPDSLDVIHSLVMDSDVIDAGGFEDWASEHGYNVDSRKAEGTYQACLEIALKLRRAIGDEGLNELRTAFEGY